MIEDIEEFKLFKNGSLDKELVEEIVRECIILSRCKNDIELAECIRETIQSHGMWLNFVRCESVKTPMGWRYRVKIGKHSVDLDIEVARSLKYNRADDEW